MLTQTAHSVCVALSQPASAFCILRATVTVFGVCLRPLTRCLAVADATSSALDWALKSEWTRPSSEALQDQQRRRQADNVEAVSRRLQRARVRDEPEETEQEDSWQLLRPAAERESAPEEEARRHSTPAPAEEREESESTDPASPPPASPASPSGSAIDLSVSANPLSCFPSLVPPPTPRHRLSVITHTPTLPKKRPFYRRDLVNARFHTDAPPPQKRPMNLRVPRNGLAPVQTPLGSGNNPLSPTPGSPYRSSGGGAGGGGEQGSPNSNQGSNNNLNRNNSGSGSGNGSGGSGGGGGGVFCPGGGGGFAAHFLGCKTEQPDDAYEGGRHSPKQYQTLQSAEMESYLSSYIDLQVEGCKPPPQPPPAQSWSIHSTSGPPPRHAPMFPGIDCSATSALLGFGSDSYDLDVELFDTKPPVGAGAGLLADGGHDLFGLESLLQPSGAAAAGQTELSHQTVVEALGESNPLPALSEPVVSSCLADTVFDGKFVLQHSSAAQQPPPPPHLQPLQLAVQPQQLPESTSTSSTGQMSPLSPSGGRGVGSPSSPSSASGDMLAEGMPALDVRISILQQRVSSYRLLGLMVSFIY